MDTEAIEFLKSRGYHLEYDWTWSLPQGQSKPSEREEDAIIYLVEEWDFGGWR